jgi:hypothetical protein
MNFNFKNCFYLPREVVPRREAERSEATEEAQPLFILKN